MGVKLNIGAGDVVIPGFTPIDAKFGHDAARLNYGDETVDAIRASHVLEHFSYRDVPNVLREWVRVLKPGGEIHISVPDFDWLCEHRNDAGVPLQAYLMGGHTDAHDYHKSAFDEPSLRELMAGCGLFRIRRWSSPNTDCAALPCSLNLCGIKPAGDIAKAVRAIISMPRVGFMETQAAIAELRAHGLDVSRCYGVFWEQGMSRGIASAIKDGFRYALTMDYDSVFTWDDVQELYRLMESHPEADAMCAVQSRREFGHPLFWRYDKDGKPVEQFKKSELDADLMPITVGHFGLTMLRLEKFDGLSKPWMQNQPNKDGDWEDGRKDADWAFWLKWNKEGRTLYSANRVVIGHIEYVVSWPTQNLRRMYQSIGAYNTIGKPAEVFNA